MRLGIFYLVVVIFLFSCGKDVEKTKPKVATISESIYASGLIKSRNQYQVFASASGIINEVFVSEGDTIKKGTIILSIVNETQRLNKNNAQLAASFADLKANEDKLADAKQLITIAKSKMENDSVLLVRQQKLWNQKIGSEVQLEQRQLAFDNAGSAYRSAIVKYNDLKRQLNLSSSQSQNNLAISNQMESDFMPRSAVDGVVYSLYKVKGEMVSPQTALAVIGDAEHFFLEMQVDENDIFKIKKELPVLVTLDSYKDQVFEAKVSRIYPMMNERSKTFLVEAEFVKQPDLLYPNVTFEANIVLQTKNNALLVPREYMLNDSTVLKSSGDTVKIVTGLKDYKQVEVLSGITAEDELIKPTE